MPLLLHIVVECGQVCHHHVVGLTEYALNLMDPESTPRRVILSILNIKHVHVDALLSLRI